MWETGKSNYFGVRLPEAVISMRQAIDDISIAYNIN